MKLKRLPDDFQVAEQISLPLGSGPFALYRLSKQSLGTLEAVRAIEQKWKLPKERIAFAGLKDRHAATTQYLTIHGGAKRGLSQANLNLDYVGQVDRPIHASDITANRFQVVVRDLAEKDAASATETISRIAADGLPNYFDDQRFGSVGESKEFIARPWCLGNYEQAVWLALADPNVHDRPLDRDEKAMIRDQWGNWEACATRLRPSMRQDALMHLARQPQDLKRAIAAFPHALRSLWLAAFQSHLWNQVLVRLIEHEIDKPNLMTHEIGVDRLPFFNSLSDDQRSRLQNAVLPLPSARLRLDNDKLQPLYDAVMAAEGLELRQVRVKYPRDTFFSKGDRRAVVQPGDFSHSMSSDDLHPGKQQLNLGFTLPRGSYATILIRRLFGGSPGMDVDEDDGGVE
jgi:tRNA pseudouridine13 synthase